MISVDFASREQSGDCVGAATSGFLVHALSNRRDLESSNWALSKLAVGSHSAHILHTNSSQHPRSGYASEVQLVDDSGVKGRGLAEEDEGIVGHSCMGLLEWNQDFHGNSYFQ
jgi:hypothetical protein